VNVTAESGVLPSLPDFAEGYLVQHKPHAGLFRFELFVRSKTVLLVLGAYVSCRASFDSHSLRSAGGQAELLNQVFPEPGPDICKEGAGTVYDRVVLGNNALDDGRPLKTPARVQSCRPGR
jgi:hypothetical protein